LVEIIQQNVRLLPRQAVPVVKSRRHGNSASPDVPSAEDVCRGIADHPDLVQFQASVALLASDGQSRLGRNVPLDMLVAVSTKAEMMVDAKMDQLDSRSLGRITRQQS
jgi:hypothetical protein